MIKSRKMRWAGAYSAYGGEERYRVLVGKHEGRIPLGRPRPRWEDDIKMGREIFFGGGGGVMDWIMWLRLGTGGGLL